MDSPCARTLLRGACETALTARVGPTASPSRHSPLSSVILYNFITSHLLFLRIGGGFTTEDILLLFDVVVQRLPHCTWARNDTLIRCIHVHLIINDVDEVDVHVDADDVDEVDVAS